jgi:hypothetical protein
MKRERDDDAPLYNRNPRLNITDGVRREHERKGVLRETAPIAFYVRYVLIGFRRVGFTSVFVVRG